MADAARKLANGKDFIDFQTDPSRYRHWKLTVDGDVATLAMDVDEKGGLFEGYELKLNSYDLGVDIELADALARLRFEHPGVKVVLLRSAPPIVTDLRAWPNRPDAAQLRSDRAELEALLRQPTP